MSALRTDIANSDGTVTTVALEEGNLITGTTQDCTPILERAKSLHNIGYQGPSRDMRLAGTVPFVLVDKYLTDNNITLQEFGRSQEHQRRFLNDPAIAGFRIWKGRI